MSGAPRRGKETVLDLEKYVHKRVRVKFTGGREVTGILKGFDPLVNLVLDECVEHMEGIAAAGGAAGDGATPVRTLGLVVCRGPNVTSIFPDEGFAEIPNPFTTGEEAS